MARESSPAYRLALLIIAGSVWMPRPAAAQALRPARGAVAGAADFSNPGRLVLADERRQTGSVGSLMVLDRGSDHGLRPGQRVTIFRPWPSGGPVLRIGEATAMIVGPETSTVRIEQSSDAIYVGDLAAIHR